MKKKPRQNRAKLTVYSVVEAATRILRESEWNHISVSTLAEKAGVGVGSIYDYFQTKDSILSEILKKQIHKNLSTLKDVLLSEELGEKDEAIDRLVEVIDEVYLRADLHLQLRIFKLAIFLGASEALFDARNEVINWGQRFIAKIHPDKTDKEIERMAFFLTHALAGLLQGFVLSKSNSNAEFSYSKNDIKLFIKQIICGI